MDRSPAEIHSILPRPHPAVMFREVSDGAVLLQTEDEIYFGLNAVGARVWQMLPPMCATLDELCARLGETYSDVGVDQLRADVVELLDALREQKLLVDGA
jgi:hypothetical protein